MNTSKKTDTDIRGLITQLEALHKRMREEGATGILQLLRDEVFSKYPKVKALAWTQYTPYFNDGDTCEFGVNAYGTPRARALTADDVRRLGLTFIVGDVGTSPLDAVRTAVTNGASDAELIGLCVAAAANADADAPSSDEDEDRGVTRHYFYEDSEYGLEWGDDRRAIDAVIGTLPNALLESAFGDHVMVYVCPTGVATAHYEHD